MIGHPHPKIGFLVTKLKEYEKSIRYQSTISFRAGLTNATLNPNQLSVTSTSTPENSQTVDTIVAAINPELPISRVMALNTFIQEKVPKSQGFLALFQEQIITKELTEIIEQLQDFFNGEFKGDNYPELEEVFFIF